MGKVKSIAVLGKFIIDNYVIGRHIGKQLSIPEGLVQLVSSDCDMATSDGSRVVFWSFDTSTMLSDAEVGSSTK